MLMPQYILARLRKASENGTGHFGVCHANKTDPAFLLEKKLEREASVISSIASLCMGIPACVTVVLFSSLSDQMGRKVTIAIPYVGGSLVGIVIALLVAFDLPFWIFFLASFGLGLSGSSMAMLAGVFASVADVTTREQRSIAIAAIQACQALAMLCTNVILGLWIRDAGFVPAVIFMSSLMIASGIFFLMIQETWPRATRLADTHEVGRVRALTNQIQHMQTTLFRDRLRKQKIFVILTAFVLTEVVQTSLQTTLTLFIMGEPFCWGPVFVGVFNAFKVAIVMTGGIFGIFLLKRCMSDLSLSIIGVISHMSYEFLIGFASFFKFWEHSLVIAIAVVVGSVEVVPSVTLRSIASALVSADEQGAIFGVMAIGDVLSLSFGPVIMNGLYAITVTSMNFFVYFFCTALLCVVLLLLIIYNIFFDRTLEESELEYLIT